MIIRSEILVDKIYKTKLRTNTLGGHIITLVLRDPTQTSRNGKPDIDRLYKLTKRSYIHLPIEPSLKTEEK